MSTKTPKGDFKFASHKEPPRWKRWLRCLIGRHAWRSNQSGYSDYEYETCEWCGKNRDYPLDWWKKRCYRALERARSAENKLHWYGK